MIKKEQIIKKIKEYFDQLQDNEDEFITAMVLRDYITETLNEEQLLIFFLRVVKGMTFYEIGDIVGITHSLAQSKYSNIRIQIFNFFNKG